MSFGQKREKCGKTKENHGNMWENIGKPWKNVETPWEKQWELCPGKYIGNTLEKNIDTVIHETLRKIMGKP